MRVATLTPQGKQVISSMPMLTEFQSNYSVVSTTADAGAVIQLESVTRGLAFVPLIKDQFLRWNPDSQPTFVAVSDATLFQQLASDWRAERGATSSVTRMAMYPAYQRLIGMGEKAVPLILRQMENEGDDPDHWFWALQSITGQNPVTEKARGDMREMARTWLDWAYMAGYDW